MSDWTDAMAWMQSWDFPVSERDESLETGRHFTGVDGNTITVLSERTDGSYFLNSVTVGGLEEEESGSAT